MELTNMGSDGFRSMGFEIGKHIYTNNPAIHTR